ncbi:hypothetical protein THIOKS1100008 [Thiocapsa sp. KS1]|nr:hypothetical protein THIOKS1100008 [Thiocapsa sp. KS1]
MPRQDSTGGRERLLGIGKRGDVYLRRLLIHGARAVLRWVERNRNLAGRRNRVPSHEHHELRRVNITVMA